MRRRGLAASGRRRNLAGIDRVAGRCPKSASQGPDSSSAEYRPARFARRRPRRGHPSPLPRLAARRELSARRRRRMLRAGRSSRWDFGTQNSNLRGELLRHVVQHQLLPMAGPLVLRAAHDTRWPPISPSTVVDLGNATRAASWISGRLAFTQIRTSSSSMTTTGAVGQMSCTDCTARRRHDDPLEAGGVSRRRRCIHATARGRLGHHPPSASSCRGR